MIEKIFKNIRSKILNLGCFTHFNEIHYDSRKIKNNDIFIALEGTEQDGHLYIDFAIDNGAKLIIVSRDIILKDRSITVIKVDNTRKQLGRIASNFYDSPEKKLKILGVTGTNGKTTTSYLLHTFLNNSSFIGSIGIEINNKRYPTSNTTPESLDIIKYAKMALENGSRYLILEVSSQGIDNYRVEGLEFDGLIFTNLSKEHLDYHKDMEDYFSVKERVFSQLKKGGIIIAPNDDKYGRRIIDKYESVTTYGIRGGEYRGVISELTIDRMKAKIRGIHTTIDIETSLIGSYNLLNILASLALLERLGEPTHEFSNKLSNLNYIDGRMQILEKKGIKVIIDYAHTEDALQKVLSTLNHCKSSKLLTLISGTGERYKDKRKELGMIASEYSDYIMVSSNSPRHEDPLSIAREVASGILSPKVSYDIEVDRRVAIHKIIDVANKGDIIILTGKGHEKYQEIMGRRYDYCEVEAVKTAFLNQL